MKKCSYCGRENSDEAVHYRECGTPFPEPPAVAEPARPRDRTWLDWLAYMLRFAGTIVFIGVLYLLSFGPVASYCGTKTAFTPPPATLAVNGAATVAATAYTVRYPAWVGVVYRPVFLMLSGNGWNGTYGRYRSGGKGWPVESHGKTRSLWAG